MAGISRYERIVLGMSAGFLLLTGGLFCVQRQQHRDVQVTAQRQEQPTAAAVQTEENAGPDSMLEGEVICVNTAGALELERLPGIGPKLAQAIVDYRQAHGAFRTVEELDRVKGIGEGTLAEIRAYVTVETTGK